jgi:hypothetical protein
MPLKLQLAAFHELSTALAAVNDAFGAALLSLHDH